MREIARRSLLAGISAAPAALVSGTLPTAAHAHPAAPVYTGGADLDALWLAWLQAKGSSVAAHRAWRAAFDRMPWWVRPGPSFIRPDGSLGGPETGWPAIQDMQPPVVEGAIRVIRPSARDIQDHYDLLVRTWGETIAAKAAETRDRSFAAFHDREAAAQIERERVGEPALSIAADKAGDAMYAAEEALLQLEPTSPAVAAAHIMAKAAFEFRESDTIEDGVAMEIAALALRGFLPMLSGEIAKDAAAFIADPKRPIGAMRIWLGIEADA